MKLLGLIFRDYENFICNQIFNFSDEYIVNYDWNETITINKNPEYIANFYGENITNITAIIGINGVGKTSLLNFLGFKFSERKEFLSKYEYFIIYELDGSIFIEFNNHSSKIKQITFNDITIRIDDGLLIGNTRSLFFKKQGDEYSIIDEYPQGNINYFFKKYYQYSFNENSDFVDTLFGNKLITRKLFSTPSNYNTIRAIRFLKVNDFITDNKILKYRVSYWSFENLQTLLVEKNIYEESIIELINDFSNTKKNYVLSRFINQIVAFFINLMLILKEVYHFWNKDIEKILLSQIKKYLTFDLNIIQINDLNLEINDSSKFLKDYFKREPTKIDKYNNYQITDFINFSLETIQFLWNTSEQIQINNNSFILDCASEHKVITDFLRSYQKILNCNTTNPNGIIIFTENNLFINLHELSSTGVEGLIKLLAQLIELISTAEIGNHIILIDEIDESFHPSWSSRIIQLLTLCCSYFADFENPLYKNPTFQFIISTHSPFILSDIKNRNVLYLEEKLGKVTTKQINTFSKNIQRIVYESMEINDIYGSFAQSKLNKIINILNQQTISPIVIEKIKIEIQNINEPIIRDKLNQMVSEKVSSSDKKIESIISNLSNEERELLKSKL